MFSGPHCPNLQILVIANSKQVSFASSFPSFLKLNMEKKIRVPLSIFYLSNIIYGVVQGYMYHCENWKK
jgi:hypothetical protein